LRRRDFSPNDEILERIDAVMESLLLIDESLVATLEMMDVFDGLSKDCGLRFVLGSQSRE
jgi:hypothetical protein